MNDLEKLLSSYELLAQAILKLGATPLIEDPNVLAQIEILAAALAVHREQLSALNELAASTTKNIQRDRPNLHLVKR
ncbi:hypothetical protein PSYCIT7_013690 [Pseudomonas syringae Cit 7]|uniref:Uncharacterized protein n=1 Tax=Pseudomonas syringae Cit 7 TaxID=629264 RepID=A0A8T8LRC3_PSESX|nr:hypothetical protein [Pseudomonas syringae]MCK9706206.1 hypothetical protein [Pseudomonas syringae pv. syringae]PBP54655.1 hypothetical protein CCL19_27185 [Pseudomonas syringae]QUP63892.1 hypothetical protein PSYCIT7_013690 [Pseudomonas syringae Cit 7]SDS62577.1 hypothetical protein SAMN05421724_1812 [Pseudomonas syringae]